MSDDMVKRLRGPIAQAAQDLIDRYFGNTDKCLASIPANPEKDADLVLSRGIAEAADRIEELEATNRAVALDMIASDERKSEMEAKLAKAVEGLERIANYEPMFDYAGSDEHGFRVDIPGSPHDRGREREANYLTGMARRLLAEIKEEDDE